MNENYIAYETLVANRAAAEWACWAMIASWVSAGATIVTLFLAFKALFTWREQEKTKVKIDFRNALKKLRQLYYLCLSILTPSNSMMNESKLLLNGYLKM
ncbi:hypothetical protein BOW93_gp071 [Salmonella phage 118970_sal3]|uniref:hypothetical protein n=1 Tax=Salmonella phage 118970_sal3 TaxID=1813771 RepID=UPI000865AF71|nr:hypothetical protein BOW93_gp071 [Salmonella phage 118970_sal3]AOE45392.2 hypothetical protein 118970sal3_00071 [Salmonella phage 118970_sal3]